MASSQVALISQRVMYSYKLQEGEVLPVDYISGTPYRRHVAVCARHRQGRISRMEKMDTFSIDPLSGALSHEMEKKSPDQLCGTFYDSRMGECHSFFGISPKVFNVVSHSFDSIEYPVFSSLAPAQEDVVDISTFVTGHTSVSVILDPAGHGRFALAHNTYFTPPTFTLIVYDI